jgi:hypothetical protein
MIPSPGFTICSIKIRIDYLAGGLRMQEGATNLVEKKLPRARWPFTSRSGPDSSPREPATCRCGTVLANAVSKKAVAGKVKVA